MIKKNSLSFRIITRVLLITISLFVLILTGYYYYARNIIRESTRENAIQLGGNLVGKIDQILQPMEKIPQMFAATMELGVFDPDSLMPVLELILKRNLNVYGTAIAFEPDYFPEKGLYHMLYAHREGNKIKTMTLGGEDYDYFYMDWYQIPAMLKEPYWSEPYYDEGAGNILMATYSVPFYCNREGRRQLAGIATVDIELEWLTDIVNEVRIFESGYAFMISRNGVAVTHPDKTQIMNSSAYSIAKEWKAPILREIGRDLLQGISRFREYNIPGRARQWIYYRNLNSNLWSIGVIYPEKEMYASLQQMNTILIILIVAGLLLLAGIIGGTINRLAAPLGLFAKSARIIAEGNFNVKLPPVKSRDEMQELHNAFTHMQNQLAQYVDNLKETTAAKEKIESELRIAREIQLSMIPHTFPPFPDLPQVTLFAKLKSAKEVGGDLYDFFVIDQNKFCFAIGDVSGKGVPASLFMAVTRTLLRSISDKEKSASAIMEALNKSLAFNNESSMFVTFFLGILDLDSGSLSYANAGHNPPVLIKNNGKIIMFDSANAIPLGLFEDFSYPESQMKLHPGDMIFAYTDGVNEAENEEMMLFGDKQMLAVLEKSSVHAGPKELVARMEHAIEQHVSGFPQSDDITMMTIQYNE
jgi:phosphoserine phosphatase RsbU/P